MNITDYVKAGYPALAVNTQEPYRAINTIHADGWKVFTWDCLQGITEPNGKPVETIIDPLGALTWLGSQSDTILVMQNFHHFLSSVEVIQAIQNSINIFKSQGSCLVLASPPFSLPIEIEKTFAILDFSLPSNHQLTATMEELGEAVGVEVNPKAVESAKGLTEFEAETAFAFSLVNSTLSHCCTG